MDENKDNYLGILVGGGIIGAFIGIIAAIILIKSTEQSKGTPSFNSKRSVQLGIGIISLLRSLANFSD